MLPHSWAFRGGNAAAVAEGVFCILLDSLRPGMLSLLSLFEVENKALGHEHFFRVVEEIGTVHLGAIMWRRYNLHRVLELNWKSFSKHLRIAKLSHVTLQDTLISLF